MFCDIRKLFESGKDYDEAAFDTNAIIYEYKDDGNTKYISLRVFRKK